MKTTHAEICQAFNISPRLLAMGTKVYRQGCPELFQMLLDGTISVHLALQICRTHYDGQRLILAEFPGMKPRERTAFVRRVFDAAARGIA